MGLKTIDWVDSKIRILDQSRLPHEEVYLEIEDYRDLASAIREMRIRGAPALGIAGGYGVALGARSAGSQEMGGFVAHLDKVCLHLRETRPTAVNLAWGIERVRRAAAAASTPALAKEAALAEAERIREEDEAANRRIGELGQALLPDEVTVLTHCNAGALACGAYGTALGVIRAAVTVGKRVCVFADETRPLLQGSRLTAWELRHEGIPVTVIADSMAGYFLRRGGVDCVLVGADRIAANGDVANKIGTYSLAVLAKENGVPFYVAAPFSSVDLTIAEGDDIPIEQRSPLEVLECAGERVAPAGVAAANPAFDVTPHRYIAAIVTERGIARQPYSEALAALARLPAGAAR